MKIRVTKCGSRQEQWNLTEQEQKRKDLESALQASASAGQSQSDLCGKQAEETGGDSKARGSACRGARKPRTFPHRPGSKGLNPCRVRPRARPVDERLSGSARAAFPTSREAGINRDFMRPTLRPEASCLPLQTKTQSSEPLSVTLQVAAKHSWPGSPPWRSQQGCWHLRLTCLSLSDPEVDCLVYTGAIRQDLSCLRECLAAPRWLPSFQSVL